MKFSKLLFIFAALFATTSVVSAQSVEDQIRKIDIKLRKDQKYLNLYYYNVLGSDRLFGDIDSVKLADNRGYFKFKQDDLHEYRIYFLMEGVEIEDIVILYVLEESKDTSGQGSFMDLGGGGQAQGPERTWVLRFKDVFFMKQDESAKYNIMKDYLDSIRIVNPDQNPFQSALQIEPDDEVETSLGMTYRNNKDYLDNSYTTSEHYYPFEVDEKSGGGGGRGGTGVEKPAFRFDVGFSSLTFSHEMLDLDFGATFGIEANTSAKVINVLPLKTNALNIGARALVWLEGDSPYPEAMRDPYADALMFDAKFYYKMPMDFSSVTDAVPIVFSDNSPIEYSPSIVFDLTMTKPFGMPFINLYYSKGFVRFTDPVFETPPVYHSAAPGRMWTVDQWQATFSFFWNGSPNLNHRFRIDIGAGYHDIVQAIYSPGSNDTTETNNLELTVKPVLQLHYNFYPGDGGDDNQEFAGVSARFFDLRLLATAWLRLYEFGSSQIRFMARLITPPIGRDDHNWEKPNGGAMFELRYRYGMKMYE
ncbi:MAG: hypothetical protein GF419_08075 [Ignavibacteriales bacterium]|nr:hypothetical protein [Ignavibacteriales bacterium]